MKRTVTNIFTGILLGFLVIGAIGVFQNIVQDIQRPFKIDSKRSHILSYEQV